jgi:hemoglobin-like flavoprotein
MTPEQAHIVMDSWNRVEPIADAAADLFYGRLFELDPGLCPLFPHDLSEQKKKLMQTLGFAVGSLSRLDTLLPAVRQLGKRHAGYGVRDEHYDTVGAALLWTLEQGLGPAWNPETRDAWAAVYGVLASTMKEAAAEVSAAAAA